MSLSNVYVELETFLFFFCSVVRQVIAVVSFMLVAFGVYLSVTLCCVRRAFNEYVYWVSLDARTHTATGTGGVRQQSGLSDWGDAHVSSLLVLRFFCVCVYVLFNEPPRATG